MYIRLTRFKACAVTALGAIAILMTIPASADPTKITMGDGSIDGSKIKPYEFTWRQCSLQDNQWVDGGSMMEHAKVVNEDGNSYLRHEQVSTQPTGMRSVATTWFDRDTLAPVKMQTTVYGPDEEILGKSEYALSENGYEGIKSRGDQIQTVSGEVSSQQFHGMAFGLPFATLDLSRDLPVEVPASMIGFDATYRVIATLGGREQMKINGKTVEAFFVDVEWHHLGLGDVYPPGPDASGGRYWVVNNPPDGVPYVPRYKTDTYAVEVVPSVCPVE